MNSAPYDPAARRDTPLALKLKERIAREGPISVSEYMRACLQDPEYGYYVKQPAIGAKGDFITAPEISQTFGELIGLWCAVVWQQMGSPEKFNLVELGPGRGTLMKDALRAARLVPGFHDAVVVNLIESSEALREVQRATLVSEVIKIHWHTETQAIPTLPTILLANEFLDTIPIDQFEFDEAHYHWRGVEIDEYGILQFARVEHPMLFDPSLYSVRPEYHPGCISEARNFSFLFDLRRSLKTAPSAMIFLDYGYEEIRVGDTLQSVREHRAEHPLTSPGEADITAHVDFTDFAGYATLGMDDGNPPLAVDGPITQAEFLGHLGIIERASKLMSANPAKAGEIEAGVARLIAPTGMGSRFKVIGVRSAGLTKLPGF